MAELTSNIEHLPEPMTEEVLVCPLCGNADFTLKFRTHDHLYRLPGEFELVECNGCGLFRMSPRPTLDLIGMYYPDNYGAYRTPDVLPPRGGALRAAVRERIRHSVLSSLGYDVGQLSLWQRLLQPWFVKHFYSQASYSYGDRFPRFVPNGKALEVGCGNCTYLGLLKRHGWTVTGVDMSTQAAIQAKAAFDIDVFVGQLESADLEAESYDYIHLSHVVEHFFDPLETMRIISHLLKPGGIAYIEVPNGAGLGAEMSGEYWYGWDPPRHLYTFTPDTCRMLFERSGLVLKRMTTGLTDTFDWEIVFRREDEVGTISDRPPKLNVADAEKAKAKCIEAEKLFTERPLSGDYIACWVEKPVSIRNAQAV